MRTITLLLLAALVLSACSGGTAPVTATTATGGACDDVAYIIPSSPDALRMIGGMYEFLQTERPEVKNQQFDADLLQITRLRAWDLMTVQFSNELGIVLFVNQPGDEWAIGWEGSASDPDEIRAALRSAFPDLPEALLACHDFSPFLEG